VSEYGTFSLKIKSIFAIVRSLLIFISSLTFIPFIFRNRFSLKDLHLRELAPHKYWQQLEHIRACRSFFSLSHLPNWLCQCHLENIWTAALTPNIGDSNGYENN
jgi:hypothetical protein